MSMEKMTIHAATSATAFAHQVFSHLLWVTRRIHARVRKHDDPARVLERKQLSYGRLLALRARCAACDHRGARGIIPEFIRVTANDGLAHQITIGARVRRDPAGGRGDA
jgi:hypothetical protein